MLQSEVIAWIAKHKEGLGLGIALVGALVGALVTVMKWIVARRVNRRRRRDFENSLSVNFGISEYTRKELLPESARQLSCNTIVFGLDSIDDNEACICSLPICIENHGDRPFNNLTIHLEYPCEFAAPSTEELGLLFSDSLRMKEDISGARAMTRVGKYYKVRHDVLRLRPGEGLVFFENLMSRCITGSNFAEFEVTSRACSEKAEGFLGLCPVRVFLYSEDLLPIKRTLLVVWLSATSTEKALQALKSTLAVFWGGKYPAPGLSFKYPWEKLMITELAKISIPVLTECRVPTNPRLKIEIDPLRGAVEFAPIVLPENFIANLNHF